MLLLPFGSRAKGRGGGGCGSRCNQPRTSAYIHAYTHLRTGWGNFLAPVLLWERCPPSSATAVREFGAAIAAISSGSRCVLFLYTCVYEHVFVHVYVEVYVRVTY